MVLSGRVRRRFKESLFLIMINHYPFLIHNLVIRNNPSNLFGPLGDPEYILLMLQGWTVIKSAFESSITKFGGTKYMHALFYNRRRF